MKTSRLPPQFMWGYWDRGHFRVTQDKVIAEQNADGFTWDNPRVRKVCIGYPVEQSPSGGQEGER